MTIEEAVERVMEHLTETGWVEARLQSGSPPRLAAAVRGRRPRPVPLFSSCLPAR